jgi:NAD-dependent SIR2 family protein deacetylase
MTGYQIFISEEENLSTDQHKAKFFALFNGILHEAAGCIPERLAEIHTHYREMPYEEFLTTPYWWVVRNYVVATRGHSCEKCGACASLNVHHISYKHRGEEYAHLSDLQVLCEACHERVHRAARINEIIAHPPVRCAICNDTGFRLVKVGEAEGVQRCDHKHAISYQEAEKQ